MQLGLGRNLKSPVPVSDDSMLGSFYLILGGVEHSRVPRPVSQTKLYQVWNRPQCWGWEPFPDLHMICLPSWKRPQGGGGLARGQLAGVGWGRGAFTSFSLPQVNWEKTAFMTQRAAGRRNKMTVVSGPNNHKWLCLSCSFFRVGEGLDWPAIIIKRLFHPVSISSIHSGHSGSLWAATTVSQGQSQCEWKRPAFSLCMC